MLWEPARAYVVESLKRSVTLGVWATSHGIHNYAAWVFLLVQVDEVLHVVRYGETEAGLRTTPLSLQVYSLRVNHLKHLLRSTRPAMAYELLASNGLYAFLI